MSLFWLVIVFGCQPEMPVPQDNVPERNVLLVTIDTLRADRLGAYGDTLTQTPNIDSLATTGVLFREAHSVTPLTLPAHASILTGLLPINHGVRDNSGFVLDDSVVTIAERVQQKGYQTGAFVSAYVLDGAWGLDQGFQEYRDPFHPVDVANAGAFGELELPAIEVVNAAIAWWNSTEGSKFSWVHLYDPHAPWDPPSSWQGDPYRAEVEYVDGVLRRLFDTVGQETLIVLTSDHGESLWEGGEREHGMLVHRAVTRVPLIVRPAHPVQSSEKSESRLLPIDNRRPDGVDENLILDPVLDAPRAAHVVESGVSLIDIAPTIAEYVGVLAFKADGRSLLSVLEKKRLPQVDLYAETLFPTYHYGFQPLRALQFGNQRIEVGLTTDSFDWTTAEKVSPSAEALHKLDLLFGREIPRASPPEGDQAAALMALGYIADAQVVDMATAPDPREHMGLVSAINSAEDLDPEQAIPKLKAILVQNPLLVAARLSLSIKLGEAGQPEAALAECEEILKHQPTHTMALNNAAVLARDLKKPTTALAYADRLLALNAKDVRGYRIKAAVHVDSESPKEVIIAATAGLRVAPEDPNLLYLLGLAYVFDQQPGAAIAKLESAIQHGSRANDIPLWLAIATERSGDVDGAVPLYEKAAQKMTGDLRPWVFAGLMLVKENRCEDARPFLINAARRGAISEPSVQGALNKCQIQF